MNPSFDVQPDGIGCSAADRNYQIHIASARERSGDLEIDLIESDELTLRAREERKSKGANLRVRLDLQTAADREPGGSARGDLPVSANQRKKHESRAQL